MSSVSKLDHKSFLIRPGSTVNLKKYDPKFTANIQDKKNAAKLLLDDVSALSELQEVLWASQSHSVLIIFQALDAAGKDSTIKHVMSGVNPQGCCVYNFRAPTAKETQHHFLWRPQQFLPERGQINIFNRSYYEETLVVRVHPEFLDAQGIDHTKISKSFWAKRFAEINAFEQTLTENNTLVLKFYLNVSKEKQKERFIERLENPAKQFKFSANDLKESERWSDYRSCYEDLLSKTSTKSAPWYVIPADHKWFMQACVADIITSRMRDLQLQVPKPSKEAREELAKILRELQSA